MGDSIHGQALLSGPARRPTVTDLRFRGDAWVEDQSDGTFCLCVGNYALAALPGLPFDLPHLNQVFNRLRQGTRDARERSNSLLA
jgi:hypothetical protein